MGTDGVCLDVIMVGTWMLCGNGRSLWGRYHGRHMDALWERTEFVGTLSWSAHGCSVGADRACGDVNMVGTWALWEWTEVVWINMIATWMLCGNGRSLSASYHAWHRDALWERTEFVGTMSWSAHGLCGNGRSCLDVVMVATWMLCLDVITVGTWMLCGNGRRLWGCYPGWHMDALWEWTEFVGTLTWLAHGLCGNGRSLSGR